MAHGAVCVMGQPVQQSHQWWCVRTQRLLHQHPCGGRGGAVAVLSLPCGAGMLFSGFPAVGFQLRSTPRMTPMPSCRLSQNLKTCMRAWIVCLGTTLQHAQSGTPFKFQGFLPNLAHSLGCNTNALRLCCFVRPDRQPCSICAYRKFIAFGQKELCVHAQSDTSFWTCAKSQNFPVKLSRASLLRQML